MAPEPAYGSTWTEKYESMRRIPRYRIGFVAAALALFAPSAWNAAPVFNIRDFGAKNDGSAPATDAFRAAIQAAKAAGGGTVLVPAGKYVTGPIELVSNLTLYFDSGAVVQFPAMRLPFILDVAHARASRLETFLDTKVCRRADHRCLWSALHRCQRRSQFWV